MNPPVDNSDKNPDGTPKDNSHNYTPEYVEDLKQKAANSSGENTILQEVIKVQNSDENKYLLELHEENPAMAGRVAKQMGYELDEALSLIKDAVDIKNPPDPKDNKVISEDELVNKAVDKMKGEKVKEFENKFFEDLPENIRDEVKQTYKEISGNGVKNQDQAKKLLDMAQTHVNKDNKTPKPDNVIKRSSLTLGGGNEGVQKPSKEIAADTQKLANELGIEL